MPKMSKTTAKKTKVSGLIIEVLLLIVIIINFYVYAKTQNYSLQIIIIAQIIALLIARSFLKKRLFEKLK